MPLRFGARDGVETTPDWQPAVTAPFNVDLELAVLDRDGLHALVFPCRRVLTGWMKVGTRERIDVAPTHWREWSDKRTPGEG
jgi:hypothetical protein